MHKSEHLWCRQVSGKRAGQMRSDDGEPLSLWNPWAESRGAAIEWRRQLPIGHSFIRRPDMLSDGHRRRSQCKWFTLQPWVMENSPNQGGKPGIIWSSRGIIWGELTCHGSGISGGLAAGQLTAEHGCGALASVECYRSAPRNAQCSHSDASSQLQLQENDKTCRPKNTYKIIGALVYDKERQLLSYWGIRVQLRPPSSGVLCIHIYKTRLIVHEVAQGDGALLWHCLSSCSTSKPSCQKCI